jgi:hypothetical protein
MVRFLHFFFDVIPAKAGTQTLGISVVESLGSRFRGNDGLWVL